MRSPVVVERCQAGDAGLGYTLPKYHVGVHLGVILPNPSSGRGFSRDWELES
jgi:hypothetical protein